MKVLLKPFLQPSYIYEYTVFGKVLNCVLQYIDDTQDPTEDEEQLGRVREWINSYHLDTIEITDVLSNFSDISVV